MYIFLYEKFREILYKIIKYKIFPRLMLSTGM